MRAQRTHSKATNGRSVEQIQMEATRITQSNRTVANGVWSMNKHLSRLTGFAGCFRFSNYISMKNIYTNLSYHDLRNSHTLSDKRICDGLIDLSSKIRVNDIFVWVATYAFDSSINWHALRNGNSESTECARGRDWSKFLKLPFLIAMNILLATGWALAVHSAHTSRSHRPRAQKII